MIKLWLNICTLKYINPLILEINGWKGFFFLENFVRNKLEKSFENIMEYALGVYIFSQYKNSISLSNVDKSLK